MTHLPRTPTAPSTISLEEPDIKNSPGPQSTSRLGWENSQALSKVLARVKSCCSRLTTPWGTYDLEAAVQRCSFSNRSFRHWPLWLNAPNLHRNTSNALPEAGVQGHPDRSVLQVFLVHPGYVFGFTRSVEASSAFTTVNSNIAMLSWGLVSIPTPAWPLTTIQEFSSRGSSCMWCVCRMKKWLCSFFGLGSMANLATSRSLMGPPTEPGSRWGPWASSGQGHSPSCSIVHGESGPSPEVNLPRETLPGAQVSRQQSPQVHRDTQTSPT